MAQLTIYLPNDVEKRFRREARRVKKSVSAYIASLADTDRPGINGWPQWFGQLYGSTAPAPLKAPPDPTPEAPRLGAQVSARHQRVHRISRRR